MNADEGPNEFYTTTFGFGVTSAGALSALPGYLSTSDLANGGPLVLTPDSKLLYTITLNELVAFQVSADGSLSAAATPSFALSDTPVGLAAHPTAEFLYSSDSSGVLSVFAIDSTSAALSLTSSVTLGSSSNTALVNAALITPDGKYLYQPTAYFANGLNQPPGVLQIAGFSIDPVSGALTAITGSPLSTPIAVQGLPGNIDGTAARLGEFALSPGGEFLYIGDSNDAQGLIYVYSIDASSGALTAVPGSPFATHARTTTIAADASGKFLFVGSVEAGSNCLHVLSIDPGTGALTEVPGSPFPPAAAYCNVIADPSESIVYAATGSALQVGPPATVYAFQADETTGALTAVGQAAVSSSVGVNADAMAITH